MTRILIQRGSGSSSNQSRAGSSAAAMRSEAQTSQTPQVPSAVKDEEIRDDSREQTISDELSEPCGTAETKTAKSDDLLMESNEEKNEKSSDDIGDNEKSSRDEIAVTGNLVKGVKVSERSTGSDNLNVETSEAATGSPQPPPPPVPPPKISATYLNSRRPISGGSNSVRVGASRRPVAWSVVSTRTSPPGSRPSSPRSHGENEGYNSADEQSPCYVSSYDDVERERQFEIDIRHSKGLEVKRMLEDGNCLFRAVADQVYGDSEAYDPTRQMCIDYMEQERDHFSQFITEGFTSYCKRKRRDKVYGNNVEIQALSEMYNRPIHIYSYSTEPINIFHGSYNTDMPPIRLSYHHGNHYNSLVNPRQLTIGAGLGFSSLQGREFGILKRNLQQQGITNYNTLNERDVDKDQIKAAIKAQQDQQIDNALLAEGQRYSDIELTEKEIERMVMEASRVEYLANEKFKQQLGCKESSTSGAEPSSSGARSSGSETRADGTRERGLQDTVLSSSMQMVLSMGFSYLQVIEAYSIFGDDVDSVVCYLLETGNSSSSRRKGKATK